MAQSSKSAPAAAGIIRAAIGAGLWAWAFASFAQGPAFAGYFHTLLGMEGGTAVMTAFGLELVVVLAGGFLMEPLAARLAGWRD